MTPFLIAAFVVLLYALMLPYIGLMLMVVVGAYRAKKRPINRERPSVSVVIPAHNEEDKLEATLTSLSKQQYRGKPMVSSTNHSAR